MERFVDNEENTRQHNDKGNLESDNRELCFEDFISLPDSTRIGYIYLITCRHRIRHSFSDIL